MLIVQAQAVASYLLSLLTRRVTLTPAATANEIRFTAPGHPARRRPFGGGGRLFRAYAVTADGGRWLVPGVSRDPEVVRAAALADRPLGQVPVDAEVEPCPACSECHGTAAIYGDFCAKCAPDE